MNIEDLIRQSVNDVLAETRTAETPGAPQATQPASGPITVNIQGRPVTFRDQADLEAQLNQTAAAIAEQQRQFTPPAPTPTPAGARVTNDDDGPSFNNDEYVKLMNEDPRKATNYALSHLMFEGKVEDPASMIREMMVSSAAQSRQLAAYQFRDAHKDVPLEDPRVGGTVEEIRKKLGLPFTADGIEAAYLYGVGKGQLPNFQAIAAQRAAEQQQQFQQQSQNPYGNQNTGSYGQQNYFGPPQVPQNPYLQGPPVSGRSAGGGTPQFIGDPEDMSVEQLQKTLLRIQSGMQ